MKELLNTQLTPFDGQNYNLTLLNDMFDPIEEVRDESKLESLDNTTRMEEMQRAI